MDEDRIRTRDPIRLGTAQRLVHTPPGDQRFHARDHAKIWIRLCVLSGRDLADELFDARQRLALAIQEAVRLRELLVFDAHSGNAALLELADQTTHVVEVAVTGVAVQ